jgi:hypothetical protein
LGCFFKGVLGKAVEIGWVFVVSLWSFCGEVVVPCVAFLGVEKNVTFLDLFLEIPETGSGSGNVRSRFGLVGRNRLEEELGGELHLA